MLDIKKCPFNYSTVCVNGYCCKDTFRMDGTEPQEILKEYNLCIEQHWPICRAWNEEKEVCKMIDKNEVR